ncbi:MAG TPA: hypothetical protein VGH20_18955 [Myxococcales bacterium]|jgi:hypothetical protein
MNLRNLIAIALLAAACTTNDRNGSLVVTGVVVGKFTAATPTTSAACTYNAGDGEEILPNYNTAGSVNRASAGFVVKNQLIDVSTLNTALNAATNNFSPHQAVVDYEILPSTGAAPVTLAQQIIPVSSGAVPSQTSQVVVVELFSPATVLAAVNGLTDAFVRTTTRIEGKLDDGTTVSTSDHDYVVHVCNGANCAFEACF